MKITTMMFLVALDIVLGDMLGNGLDSGFGHTAIPIRGCWLP